MSSSLLLVFGCWLVAGTFTHLHISSFFFIFYFFGKHLLSNSMHIRVSTIFSINNQHIHSGIVVGFVGYNCEKCFDHKFFLVFIARQESPYICSIFLKYCEGYYLSVTYEIHGYLIHSSVYFSQNSILFLRYSFFQLSKVFICKNIILFK